MSERLRSFAGDLWFDLRERKLAPLVIALAVAIVAVPIALGGPDSPAPAETRQQAPVEVIETQPAVSATGLDGVRDASDRLTARVAKNPFRRQLQSLPKKGEIADAATPPGTQSAGLVAEPAEAAAQAGAVAVPASEPAQPPSAEPATEIRTRTRTIVKLERRSAEIRFGELGDRKRIRGLEPLDSLPPEGDPLIVLLGVDEHGRAKFDVASRATNVWGKGSCSPARGECEYLSLKPGEGAKLRYEPYGAEPGAEPIVYSLSLLKIDTRRVDG